jgi:hypothetical protein
MEAVEAAWERHRALAAAIITNPRLLLDRNHMEASALAERAFRSIFARSIAASRGEAG